MYVYALIPSVTIFDKAFKEVIKWNNKDAVIWD